MGCGNSSRISISIDRANAFYFTDEIVSGTVELNVIKGKVEADEIFIQLTGEIGYTTQRTVHDSNNHTRTETDYHHEPFYQAKASFALPQSGEKKVIYKEGKYSWPFHISFINQLPPSISQPESYPHVRYYLQVVIDKPWFKINKRETKYLTVYPRINLLQNPQCLSSIIYGNHNRKDITVKGTLNKTGYVPGELVHITIEIINPQRITIKSIHLSMLQSYRIGQNSRGFSIFETTLPRIMNTKDEHIQDQYSVLIPSTTLPPSYQFQGGIYKVNFVNLSYMLRFAVKVEGFFTNFDIDIPVIIGTEPTPELNYEQTSNHLAVAYSSNPEQSMFADHDLPPSYESVTHNTK